MLKKLGLFLMALALVLQVAISPMMVLADEYEVEAETEVAYEVVEAAAEGYEEEIMEVQNFNTGQTIEQATIDAMNAFLANNSAANPFIVPAGLTFAEAMNAINWGANVTVNPILEGDTCPALSMGGSRIAAGAIALILNQQLATDGTYTYDDDYWFFEVGIHTQFEGAPRLSQTSIDAMYAFLANNSADNPLMIPAGLTVAEAINALNWGASVTALLALEGTGVLHGSLHLALDSQIRADGEHICSDIYSFKATIHVLYEESRTNEPNNNNNLPKTGVAASMTFAAGAGLAGIGMVAAYIKNKKK